MNQLTIKEITKEKISECAKVILEAFNEMGEEFGFQRNEDLSPLKMRLVEYVEHDAKLFGAFLEDIQIGFFLLDSKDQEVFEIGKLCILPSYQGKGYGQYLLNYAFDMIEKLNGVSAVCAIIGENTRLKSWLMENYFVEEFSGPLPGAECTICLMQRDVIMQKSECNSNCNSCSSCS